MAALSFSTPCSQWLCMHDINYKLQSTVLIVILNAEMHKYNRTLSVYHNDVVHRSQKAVLARMRCALPSESCGECRWVVDWSHAFPHSIMAIVLLIVISAIPLFRPTRTTPIRRWCKTSWPLGCSVRAQSNSTNYFRRPHASCFFIHIKDWMI